MNSILCPVKKKMAANTLSKEKRASIKIKKNCKMRKGIEEILELKISEEQINLNQMRRIEITINKFITLAMILRCKKRLAQKKMSSLKWVLH